MEQIAKEGYDPSGALSCLSASAAASSLLPRSSAPGSPRTEYIRWYNLRSYDRINAPRSFIKQMEERSGIEFYQAQGSSCPTLFTAFHSNLALTVSVSSRTLSHRCWKVRRLARQLASSADAARPSPSLPSPARTSDTTRTTSSTSSDRSMTPAQSISSSRPREESSSRPSRCPRRRMRRARSSRSSRALRPGLTSS